MDAKHLSNRQKARMQPLTYHETKALLSNKNSLKTVFSDTVSASTGKDSCRSDFAYYFA